MTEGIIQQAFKRMIEYYGIQSDKTFYGKHIKWTFEDLQQELIEQIKQLCDENYDNGEEYPDTVSRYDLIGDNQ